MFMSIVSLLICIACSWAAKQYYDRGEYGWMWFSILFAVLNGLSVLRVF